MSTVATRPSWQATARYAGFEGQTAYSFKFSDAYESGFGVPRTTSTLSLRTVAYNKMTLAGTTLSFRQINGIPVSKRSGTPSMPILKHMLTNGLNDVIARQSSTKGVAASSPLNHIIPLLNDIVTLSESGQQDSAIDLCLKFFNETLYEQKYQVCDQALQFMGNSAVKKLTTSVLVSTLAITMKARSKLGYRTVFFELVYDVVKRTKGRRYAKSLLEKYR